MASIPLATLMIVMLALPGYISRLFYFSGLLNKSILPKSFKDDIASSIIFSFPIHLLGIFLVEHLHHWFAIVPDINFHVTFLIISGHIWDDSNTGKIILDNVYTNIHWIISYCILLIVAAAGLGKGMNFLVWNFFLDLRLPSLFEFGNTWLYTLTGRKDRLNNPKNIEIFPVVDALAELGEKTRLYRGIVFDFNTDDSGSLKEIFLMKARRGKFKPQDDVLDKSEFYWEIIPGNIFMLPYKSIINLNITYFQIPQEN